MLSVCNRVSNLSLAVFLQQHEVFSIAVTVVHAKASGCKPKKNFFSEYVSW